VTQRYQLNANGPERPQVLANLHAFVDRLPANKSWRVEIKEARKERTGDQNAALWAVAYPPLMDYMGESGEDAKKRLHEFFCGEFFGWVRCPITGNKPRRTTTRNERGERDLVDTLTMARFYENVQRVGAENGIDIPNPDPMHGVRERWAA
jgi:hypothetical protein